MEEVISCFIEFNSCREVSSFGSMSLPADLNLSRLMVSNPAKPIEENIISSAGLTLLLNQNSFRNDERSGLKPY